MTTSKRPLLSSSVGVPARKLTQVTMRLVSVWSACSSDWSMKHTSLSPRMTVFPLASTMSPMSGSMLQGSALWFMGLLQGVQVGGHLLDAVLFLGRELSPRQVHL